jgi:hypothetical protein
MIYAAEILEHFEVKAKEWDKGSHADDKPTAPNLKFFVDDGSRRRP